jgi:hypothetical protein
MRRGNTNYHLIQAKLGSLYGCDLTNCYDHPEHLHNVLKDVYKEDYISVIKEIKLELAELVNVKQIYDFLKIMER